MSTSRTPGSSPYTTVILGSLIGVTVAAGGLMVSCDQRPVESPSRRSGRASKTTSELAPAPAKVAEGAMPGATEAAKPDPQKTAPAKAGPAVPAEPATIEQRWHAMPLVTRRAREAGVLPGGEGCQAPCTIVADQVDGSLVFLGTDVGGIFRSVDGGRRWTPNNAGLKSTGFWSFAIDPRNIDRSLAAGLDSGNEYVRADGLFLSTDKGRTWSQVIGTPKVPLKRDAIDLVAFDGSSFDAQKGHCTRAYFALQRCEKTPPALYRSDDGGVTWVKSANASSYGGEKGFVFVDVNSRDGAVYVASQKGFFLSRDRGRTFERTLVGGDGANAVDGMCAVAAKPDNVWVGRGSELMHSSDGGRTFEAVEGDGTVQRFLRIRVSPADPKRIAVLDGSNRTRLVSHDGGKTWKTSRHLYSPNDFFGNDVRAGFNGRCHAVAWHAKDPDVAWAIGPGDVVYRSDDGGVTFEWSNNGINNIMIGGLFNFAVEAPDSMYFGSQDYNGGITRDAGETWEFVNLTVSNTRDAVRQGGNDSDPWGWVYGGYSPDGTIMYGGNKEYQDDKFDLWITFDGGKTSQRKVTKLTGAQVSYSDPADRDVLFCWGYRSADRGRTWARLDGCDGVYTASAGDDRALFGRSGTRLVKSTDHGVTWQRLGALPQNVRDVAYDHRNDRVWAACDDQKLYRLDGPAYEVVNVRGKLPVDHFGHGMVCSTVAVDPTDPRVVYVGACGTGLWVMRDNAVARSLDGGETWERLTCNPDYCPDWETGGMMASAIRVSPKNRWLYVATCCFGLWRFPPPPAYAVGKPVQDKRYVASLEAANVESVRDVAARSAGSGPARKVIRDFGPAGFNYTYGGVWQNNANVKPATVGGVGCVAIDTTEKGGAGLVMSGANMCPAGQTHLTIVARLMPGNRAGRIAVNIIGAKSGNKTTGFDLSRLNATGFTSLSVRLPGAPSDYASIQQIQVQGTNWGGGAQPLKIYIDRIETTEEEPR